MSKQLKITNLGELRDHALSVLEKLEKKEIDVAEAGVVGKLCESVISTVKVQLEYSRMVKREPKIEFIGNCTGRMIEGTTTRKLLKSGS